jgi:hypothetical protein
VGGLLAIRALVLSFRRSETWIFRRDEIVAGRNWQYPSLRVVPIADAVGVRMSQGVAGPMIEILSEGTALWLGPFQSAAPAHEVVKGLQGQHPSWRVSISE